MIDFEVLADKLSLLEEKVDFILENSSVGKKWEDKEKKLEQRSVRLMKKFIKQMNK